MTRYPLVLLLGLLARSLSAEAHGSLEAEADGQLERLEASWLPAPGVEGRWWWRPGTGGAAWVRWESLQVGPLQASTDTQGRRSWRADTGSAAGSWGVAAAPGPFSVWGVQTPGWFEAGAQAASSGAVTFVMGANRSWNLNPETGKPAWIDGARTGIEVASGPLSGAVGLRLVWPAGEARRWETRGDVTVSHGDWSLKAGAASLGPEQPWTAMAAASWQGLVLSWEGRATKPEGRWTARAGGTLEVGTLTANFGALASGPRLPRVMASLELEGPAARGRWSAAWTGTTAAPDGRQKVSLGWRERAFEAGAEWSVEGLRLGWLGPGSTCTLRWKALF